MAQTESPPATPATERPLSPHLLIYKPQMSSVSSILHRITGAALVAGSFLLVAWLWAAAYSPDNFARLNGFLSDPIGRAFLIGWTLAFYYHFFNGIRHLVWDAGYGFEIKTSIATGYTVFFFTALFTALTWGWALGLVGGVS